MMWIIQIKTECINIGFIVFYLAYVVCHCLHKYSTQRITPDCSQYSNTKQKIKKPI